MTDADELRRLRDLPTREVVEFGIALDLIDLERRYAELEAENAKLRELVAQIWPVVEHPARWCDRCEYFDKCLGTNGRGRFVWGCQWRDDMRELAHKFGIEVRE